MKISENAVIQTIDPNKTVCSLPAEEVARAAEKKTMAPDVKNTKDILPINKTLCF